MKNVIIVKSQRGITLISLVVTIIVLLILAGVTINLALSNNGIIQRVRDASDKTQESQKDEEIRIAILGSYENNSVLDIEKLLINLNTIQNITVKPTEDNGTNTFPVTVTTEYTTYEIMSNGNFDEVQIEDRTELKVGDYVNYTYVGSNTVKSITLDNAIAGIGTYSDNKLITPTATPQTISAKTGLKWRILNINEDGTVDLTCEGTGTSTYIGFRGARGYTNGVIVLNNLCRELFAPSTSDTNINKNSSKITVRNMTVEDIEKHLITTVLNGTKVHGYARNIKYGGNGAVATSGTTQSYTEDYNKKYPRIYADEKYSGVRNGNNKEQSDNIINSPIIEIPGDNDWTEVDSADGLTVTQTYYAASLNRNDMKNSDNDSGTDVYDMLIQSQQYWLASRFVSADSTSEAAFGLRCVSGWEVKGYNLFESNGWPTEAYYQLKPVVSLGSSVIIETCNGTNSSTNMHEIK